jgi:DNA-binding PucR family transcriptional regulator
MRPWEGPESRQALERAIAEVPEARLVLSPACTELGDYRRHFLACERALSLLAGRLRIPVIDLDETRVLALLFGHASGTEVQGFVAGTVGELLEYDEQHGSELVATLDAYFQAGSSPSRTAALLHVHVNTVYYRLDRIKDLIGSDFTTPRRALDLQVALLARMLLDGLDRAPSPEPTTS